MAPLFIPFDPCRSPDKLKSLFILGNWQRTGGEKDLGGGGCRGLEEEEVVGGKMRPGEGYPGKNASMGSVTGPGFLKQEQPGMVKEGGVFVELWCWGGGSTLKDRARRPETNYTRKTSH